MGTVGTLGTVGTEARAIRRKPANHFTLARPTIARFLTCPP